MIMTPRLRKFTLTAHITFSVGWLGAVAGFLALAIAALSSQNVQMVRAAYFAMELIGWYVIVPFCLASLLTGLVQSLVTKWGLFRHYWVLTKFVITVVSALILFGFTQTLGNLGNLAADTTLSIDELRDLGQSPVIHSGGGLLALLATTTLSVYKPWGMTKYGQRKTTRSREDTNKPSHPDSNDTAGLEIKRGLVIRNPWRLYVLLGTISTIMLFVVLHFFGGLGSY